jgi:hypothetical protein
VTPEEARSVVRATLMELGLDISNPTAVIDAQADFAYVRKSRKAQEAIVPAIRKGLLTVILPAALLAFGVWVWGAFWQGHH